MRFSAVFCSLALGVPALVAQTIEPGTGSPTEAVRSQFENAFARGSFSRIAALPPAGAVKRFGATGLIQEFNDSTRSSGKLALIKSTSTADLSNPSTDVFQMLTDMYAYYSSVGVTTAGYPTNDTQFCPAVSCTWQLFDRKYALFTYTAGANDPQTITVKDPFYTRWDYFGGMSKMGPATSAETSVTSSFSGVATMQSFASAVLFNITSGALRGRLVSVRQPVYALYVQRGGATGPLGFPTSDEQTLSTGKHRQTFEGGSIDYDDTSGPVFRPPVNSVVLRPSSSPVRMNAGDTLTITAAVIGSDGSETTDRVVNFTTTNGRVVSIQATGQTAVLRAVGGGTARVTASSEGKVSLPIDIIVSAQCCAIGEGAPSTAIQQAMNDAVTRTRIQLRVPGPERVRRSGSGYVQEFQGADPNGNVSYLITISDRSAQAYIVSGPTLARYEQLGGPAGALAFANSDPVASGRQSFEGGVLAGTPVRMVSGAILRRWAQTGYETGAPGLPVSEASSATSFTATAGQLQSFAGGLIVNGPRGAFFVRGAAADRYLSLGGILSPLGFALGEESVSGSVRRQEFEGGTIEYSDGGDVQVISKARTPAISATPASALPGSRVRVSVSGFPDRATLRVSVTGQVDFVVNTQTGAYLWDVLVPPTATPSTVTVRAVDTSTNVSVQGTYTIRALAQARLQLAIVAGDGQSGAPGTLLPIPLRVSLKDETNSPVAGATVRFSGSPGAVVTPATVVTDTTGVAQTSFQLPPSDGIALVTAEAAGKVVTFSARSIGSSILAFPKLMQAGTDPLGFGQSTIADSGALLASAASTVRYLQVRGDLRNPNGLADVASLNEYLRRTCVTDAQGVQTCDGFLTLPGSGEQVVNLWRLSSFVGGGLDISIEKPDQTAIRSLVAGGSPVIVALSLSMGDKPAGSHFVVATGIATDGSLQIHDPNPLFAQTSISGYINGFVSSGQTWKGTITGAVRFVARTPLSTSFVVSSSSPIRISSAAGECGLTLEFPDTPAKSQLPANSIGLFRQRSCDGTGGEYQIEVGSDSAFRATVIDLAEGGSRSDLTGSGAAAFRVSRVSSFLSVSPQETVLNASAILNAATYTREIAVGGLFSIFGNGLARNGSTTKVDIGGRSATVLLATPFQINAQIPPELTAGSYTLRVESPYGTAEQQIEIRPVAPAVFRTAGGDGIIVNPNGSLNNSQNPARRGDTVVLYATGLGATVRSGNLNPAQTPLTVLLAGQELRPAFAGLTPGFIGLYQINLSIPAAFPPGLDQDLRLRQGTVESWPVEISIF